MFTKACRYGKVIEYSEPGEYEAKKEIIKIYTEGSFLFKSIN